MSGGLREEEEVWRAGGVVTHCLCGECTQPGMKGQDREGDKLTLGGMRWIT